MTAEPQSGARSVNYDPAYRRQLESNPEFMSEVADGMGLGRERIDTAIAETGIQATATAFMLWILCELDGVVLH